MLFSSGPKRVSGGTLFLPEPFVRRIRLATSYAQTASRSLLARHRFLPRCTRRNRGVEPLGTSFLFGRALCDVGNLHHPFLLSPLSSFSSFSVGKKGLSPMWMIDFLPCHHEVEYDAVFYSRFLFDGWCFLPVASIVSDDGCLTPDLLSLSFIHAS